MAFETHNLSFKIAEAYGGVAGQERMVPRLTRVSTDIVVEPELSTCKLPAEKNVLMDLSLGTLLNGAWQGRRVVVSKTGVYFTLVGDDDVRDHIPLEEITEVLVMHDADDLQYVDDPFTFDSYTRPVQHKDLETFRFLKVFQIRTIPHGFNSGRTYYLQADTSDMCEMVVRELSKLTEAARIRAEGLSKFRQSQKTVRSVIKSTPYQIISAFLIIANFSVCILQSQLNELRKTSADLAALLDFIDLAFVVVFSAEVAVNAYAHWFQPFVSNVWSMFDLTVVVLSLICFAPFGLPVTLVLLLRSCRVLRIFGRIPSVSKILAALSTSIIPMLNSFLIIFVLSSIYAIFAVSLYGDSAPDDFETFCRAFIAMFRITMGSVDWWFEYFPAVTSDGTINWGSSAFIITYIILVNWIFFQVSIAVLLDNFLSASNKMKLEQQIASIREKQLSKQFKNPLDPLLLRLAKDYINDEDLSARLEQLFKILDDDSSGWLSTHEFQAAMKKLNFNPPLFVSDSDFIAITRNGELCNANGQLGPLEFETVMREQIRGYTQARLSSTSEFWATADRDFTTVGALKQILADQTRLRASQDRVQKHLDQLLSVSAGPATAVGSGPPERLRSTPSWSSLTSTCAGAGAAASGAADFSALSAGVAEFGIQRSAMEEVPGPARAAAESAPLESPSSIQAVFARLSERMAELLDSAVNDVSRLAGKASAADWSSRGGVNDSSRDCAMLPEADLRPPAAALRRVAQAASGGAHNGGRGDGQTVWDPAHQSHISAAHSASELDARSPAAAAAEYSCPPTGFDVTGRLSQPSGSREFFASAGLEAARPSPQIKVGIRPPHHQAELDAAATVGLPEDAIGRRSRMQPFDLNRHGQDDNSGGHRNIPAAAGGGIHHGVAANPSPSRQRVVTRHRGVSSLESSATAPGRAAGSKGIRWESESGPSGPPPGARGSESDSESRTHGREIQDAVSGVSEPVNLRSHFNTGQTHRSHAEGAAALRLRAGVQRLSSKAVSAAENRVAQRHTSPRDGPGASSESTPPSPRSRLRQPPRRLTFSRRSGGIGPQEPQHGFGRGDPESARPADADTDAGQNHKPGDHPSSPRPSSQSRDSDAAAAANLIRIHREALAVKAMRIASLSNDPDYHKPTLTFGVAGSGAGTRPARAVAGRTARAARAAVADADARGLGLSPAHATAAQRRFGSEVVFTTRIGGNPSTARQGGAGPSAARAMGQSGGNSSLADSSWGNSDGGPPGARLSAGARVDDPSHGRGRDAATAAVEAALRSSLPIRLRSRAPRAL